MDSTRRMASSSHIAAAGNRAPVILRTCLQPFRRFFTVPIWEHVLILLMGALLAPGKRTVTAVLRITGRRAATNFTCYHQVLNRALERARHCLPASVADCRASRACRAGGGRPHVFLSVAQVSTTMRLPPSLEARSRLSWDTRRASHTTTAAPTAFSHRRSDAARSRSSCGYPPRRDHRPWSKRSKVAVR